MIYILLIAGLITSLTVILHLYRQNTLLRGDLVRNVYIMNDMQDEFRRQESSIRKDAISRSDKVLWGNSIENFAPFFESFPVPATDVTFLGKPIDYIGFTDTDSKTDCTIHIIEVKSGSSRLTPKQSNIKKAVMEKRIEWHEVTMKPNIEETI